MNAVRYLYHCVCQLTFHQIYICGVKRSTKCFFGHRETSFRCFSSPANKFSLRIRLVTWIAKSPVNYSLSWVKMFLSNSNRRTPRNIKVRKEYHGFSNSKETIEIWAKRKEVSRETTISKRWHHQPNQRLIWQLIQSQYNCRISSVGWKIGRS